MARRVVCLIFLSMVALSPHAQAINCVQVVQMMMPCIGYLKNGGAIAPVCCNGVKDLYNTAKAKIDRQQACVCIKDAAKSFGINYTNANMLPGKCGVDYNMHLSPNTDCTKIE